MEATGNAVGFSKRGRHLFGLGAVFALTVLATLLHASAAWAEVYTVTSTANGGVGSLREAITKANSRAGTDEIVFAEGVSGTITLASTLPTITDPAGLIIDGGGDVTVSGNDAVRIFLVGEVAALSLRNLTVSDGVVADIGSGGGMLNEGGTVEVTGTTFSDNEAFRGGGIYNRGGDVEVTDSTFSNNDAAVGFGGGIFNDEGGALTISNSTFSGNFASEFGGGVFNDRGAQVRVADSTFLGNETGDLGAGIANFGTLGVTDTTFSGGESVTGGGIHNEEGATVEVGGSTFSDNDAPLGGGGISNFRGALTVTNSTFSGNRSGEGGGGIFSSGTLEVTNSTLHGNSTIFGGGGVHNSRGTATLRGTIVANNAGGNCGGSFTDGGYNVEDDGTCGFTQDTGSLPDTDPLLDPDGLQDNGGPTKTIALQPDGPAVDLVGEEACPPPATDQRGVERPQGGACDSGAFELRQEPPRPPECTLRGTPGADFLKGTSGNDVICAKGGNDVVVDYKGGNDTLLGSGGKDVLLDVRGKGLLKGGDGNDVLFTLDEAPLDTMNGQSGSNDLCLGDNGDVRKNCERGSLFGLSGEQRERLAEAKDAAGL